MTRKVLIVDDSKLARMSVAKFLTTLHPDWTRVEASNADEAIEIAEREEIDVALVDFNMPGRDGLALIAQLHALKPKIALAVVSANLQVEIVDRAKAIGAAFLPKPLTAPVLSEFLETIGSAE